MKLSALLEELRSTAWAMEPKRLRSLAAAAAGAVESRRSSSFDEDDDEDDDGPLYDLDDDGLAQVAVMGVLVRKKPRWFSWCDVDATEMPRLKAAIEAAAADPSCSAIVLRVDSPGGQAAGVQEVADAIAAAAKEKPVHCVVESLCASGAYWLASQADSISAPKDAEVGSIGVFSVLVDDSKMHEDAGVKVHVVRSGEHKGTGVAGSPITDNHLAAEQELIDGFAKLFKKSVASGRKATLDDVDAVATGQTWLAGAAKTKGLIDAVEPVDRALSRMAPGDDDDMDPKSKKPQTDAVELARAEDRARLAELKAAFPGNLAFAFEQYEAGATPEQAKAAHADVLAGELAKERAAKADLQVALDKAKASRPAPAAPPAGEPVPFAGSADASNEPADFVARTRERAKTDGITFAQAASRIAREDPQAHDEWVESQPQKKLSSKGLSYTRIGKPQR